MRVLLPIIWHELTHCIGRAFEEAGHEVKVLDWRTVSRKHQLRKVEPEIISAIRQFRPEFAFFQLQRGDVISQTTCEELKRVGCFSVNWSGDVRDPLPDWYKLMAPFFDVTAFSNQTDVDTIRAMGHHAEFLQVGYEERIYNTTNADERTGVVFIGNNYGQKYQESGTRAQMVHALHNAFGDRFQVFGMGWEQYGGVYVREADDAHVLKQSLVAVGWDHFHRPGFASDRLLRATACGCATINQYYEGIEQEHPDVVAVRSIGEMVEAVGHALEHPVESAMIGDLCAQNTLKQHRWNNRVEQMMKWL